MAELSRTQKLQRSFLERVKTPGGRRNLCGILAHSLDRRFLFKTLAAQTLDQGFGGDITLTADFEITFKQIKDNRLSDLIARSMNLAVADLRHQLDILFFSRLKTY